MITIFSLPKPFQGHIGVIQRNAILSWTQLPGCNVILFGDEPGLAEFAQAHGIAHVHSVERNESGTPLLRDVFERAKAMSETPMTAYVNADIILTDSFLQAANVVSRSGLSQFLVVGQRWDLDVVEPLEFQGNWAATLRQLVNDRGTLHGKAGIDYFLFPRNLQLQMPAFAVGRPGWDNWFIFHMRIRRIPVVDGTDQIIAIHQNHAPAYKPNGLEAKQNAALAGGRHYMATIRNADRKLTSVGVCQLPLMEAIAEALLFSRPVRWLLGMKRSVQSRISAA